MDPERSRTMLMAVMSFILSFFIPWNGEQFVNGGGEVAAGAETMPAPAHEQAAALFPYVIVQGMQKVRRDGGCGEVVDDDQPHAGEVAGIKPVQAGRLLDAESLRFQERRQGVAVVAGEQQDAVSSRHFKEADGTVVFRDWIVLRRYGHFISGTAGCGEPVRQPHRGFAVEQGSRPPQRSPSVFADLPRNGDGRAGRACQGCL